MHVPISNFGTRPWISKEKRSRIRHLQNSVGTFFFDRIKVICKIHSRAVRPYNVNPEETSLIILSSMVTVLPAGCLNCNKKYNTNEDDGVFYTIYLRFTKPLSTI